MDTAYDKRLIVTSNHGSLIWQPEDTTHDDDNFIFGGYLFGPVKLQDRVQELLFDRDVTGLAGYRIYDDDTTRSMRAAGEDPFPGLTCYDRHVSISYKHTYPLRLASIDERPEHTSRAADLVAAMTAAHGDYSVTYNQAAQELITGYIEAVQPGFFDVEPYNPDNPDTMIIY